MNRQLTPQDKAIAVVTDKEIDRETGAVICPATVMIRTEDGRVVWITKEKFIELANKVFANQAAPAPLPASRLVQ